MEKDNNEFISIGKIMSSHGIHGYAKVFPLTDFPDRFKQLKTVYLFRENTKITETSVQEVKFTNSSTLLIKLSFFTNPEDVKKYTNCLIKIPDNEKLDLPEDFFYIDDLKGVEVYLVSGEFIGTVKEIYSAGNDVLEVITGNKKEIMIPFVKDLVPEVDLKNNRITVNPLPGLLDGNYEE